MGDKLIMSKKERQRKAILEQVLQGHITGVDASKRLHMSYRQLKRIRARYKTSGDIGLVHKNRGKRSGRAYPETFKKQVISVYEEKYLGYGPTLASEKLLEEEGLEVHRETLRLWLKAEGLWQHKRKRKAHRSRRMRRARFGELLQLDGSHHQWFEGEEERPCLMNLVDDATGTTLALMDVGETTRGAFLLLQQWIQTYGIPMEIYVDLKSLYVSPKSLKQKEEDGEDLVEPEWLTQFSAACKKLGIGVIKAYSAQAKGRVERSHAVYQDRFVKELSLKNIKTIEGANELLSQGFVNKLNEKFAKVPRDPKDAHVPLSSENDLDQIFCWEYTRVVRNDWTISFKTQHYQIEKTAEKTVFPKQNILVRQHLDDSVSLWCQDQPLPAHPIDPAPKKPKVLKGQDAFQRARISRENKHKTPWGQYDPFWLKSKKSREKAMKQNNKELLRNEVN